MKHNDWNKGIPYFKFDKKYFPHTLLYYNTVYMGKRKSQI